MLVPDYCPVYILISSIILQETLRKHVESELLSARKKIEAITKKLEEVRGLGAFQHWRGIWSNVLI